MESERKGGEEHVQIEWTVLSLSCLSPKTTFFNVIFALKIGSLMVVS